MDIQKYFKPTLTGVVVLMTLLGMLQLWRSSVETPEKILGTLIVFGITGLVLGVWWMKKPEPPK